MQDIKQVVDQSVANAGFVKELENSVPQLLKFYVEEFISGQKKRQKQALKGLEEIGEMLNLASEEAISEEELARLRKLQINYLESYCLVGEYQHGPAKD